MPMASDFLTSATKYLQSYSVIYIMGSQFSNLMTIWQVILTNIPEPQNKGACLMWSPEYNYINKQI